MPLFASPREQRLWLWTLTVVLAVFASLGFGGKLAGFLRVRGLLGVSFGLGLLMAAGAVAAQWIKTRRGRREIWVALAVVSAYFMTWVRIETSEERTHLFEYGLVAVLVYQALLERVRNGRQVPAPYAVSVAATALLGLFDEGIQWLLPERFFDIRDVGFNALAALMAVAASLALSWARRR